MAATRHQTRIATHGSTFLQSLKLWLEKQLDREAERLALWLPVFMGCGIAIFFALPSKNGWLAAASAALGFAVTGWMWRQWRFGKVLALSSLMLLLGLVWIWVRAAWLASPILAYPITAEFSAYVETVQAQPARGKMRLFVVPVDRPDLPKRIRLTASQTNAGDVVAGEYIGVRARLIPPPLPDVPGGYDFSRRAWFEQIGAVGSVLGDVARSDMSATTVRPSVRARLTAHIHGQVEGDAGGIAAALVTGDRGAVSDEVEEAMRRSGLAHLLSISGLHVTAVIGFAMLASMKLLALIPRFALSSSVVAAAAGMAALVGGAYTLLAGAEVPTLRSFIAASLVLIAILLGREAVTLRLVAAGALLILIWRPEALVGASFQLSFAAVTAIVALHEWPRMREFLARRDEIWLKRFGRSVVGLVVTGLVVEVALTPIALFHFHKSGIYGAAANVVAIPLTTFVIMPFEALGMLFDAVGMGAPFWWVVEQAIGLLIWLAVSVSDLPGSVRTFSEFPAISYGLILAGGIWLLFWKTEWRLWGLAPILLGVFTFLMAPTVDLVVFRDGRQVAARVEGDQLALLRLARTQFSRSQLMEAAGSEMEPIGLRDWDGAECNLDFCRWTQLGSGEKPFVILATRSKHYADYEPLIAACRHADIVISDRNLPRACAPKFLLLTRDELARRGGALIHLGETPKFLHENSEVSDHPWRNAEVVEPLWSRRR